MNRNLALVLMIVFFSAASSLITWWALQRFYQPEGNFLDPLLESTGNKERPLLAYTIPTLSQRSYTGSQIRLESVLSDSDEYTSYLFSYTTLGKRMTGQLNLPRQPLPNNPVIVMLRGYVPPGSYETGVGTRNGAAEFAKHGFITVAPDFFSYGDSDPEPEDVWQGRFEKPMVVIELIKTLQNTPLEIDNASLENSDELDREVADFKTTLAFGPLGMWGHSNGGQIALTTLEILGEPIPTTLWAPVTAPFPYSLLFFSDENADEGKDMRKWISLFEDDYDVFDFSLTQHLHRLRGPLQLHHGTSDDAALKAWSDEFMDKMDVENERREAAIEAAATQSASIDESALQPIEITYHTYPGADHNLQPGWNTVVERDIEFFTKNLTQ